MKLQRIAVSGVLGCFILALPAQGPLNPQRPIQLWYWHHCYLSSDWELKASEKLVDRAVALGYTGVAFWDSGFDFIGQDFFPLEIEGRMGELMRYAAKKHLKVLATPTPFGYSNEALEADPNLAEAQRVIGTEYRVHPSGRWLVRKNSFPGLKNFNFEKGKTDWFDLNDSGVGINTVAHSGKTSAVIVDATGNARLRQKFPLKPWRQYHLRLFYRSAGFKGAPMLSVFDSSDFDKLRLNAYFNAKGNHDWTQVDYTFNSQDSTEGYLYLGIWGGSTGILWLDDIQIYETGLVYVVRRAGAPFKMYDPSNPATVYREGVDYNPVADPHIASSRTPFTDTYHDPVTITLPRHTHLKPGQTVAIDSYAAFPSPYAKGIAMCMTEPAAWNWVAQNSRAIKKILPPGGGFLIGYDEIRQMNSCALCRARKMTAGQLLAWSIAKATRMYRDVDSEAPLYTWNDMFDPYHNAHDHYFYVEGDLTGSWKGMPAELRVMNWNLGSLKKSLTWFSGLDSQQPVAHQQLIAGFYDAKDGAAEARKELSEASGIPGILGLMYTTWDDDYSQLESFAAGAKAAWQDYLSSVSQSSSASSR